MLKTALATALASTLAPLADETPIWERHDKIICVSEKRIDCDLKAMTCKTDKMNARWSLDFGNGKVKYLTGDFSETIIGKSQQRGTDGELIGEDVYLSSGRVMEFFAYGIERPMDSIVAYLAGGYGNMELSSIEFICTPDNEPA